MDNRSIGRRVMDLREKLGITTTELAKRVGISQAQMSRLENGKQGYRSGTLERVAKALEVKPLYFYIEDSPKGVAEGAPVYGLAAGGELVEALRSAEFVRVVEKVAEAFHSRRPAFDAINLAVRAIVGEEK